MPQSLESKQRLIAMYEGQTAPLYELSQALDEIYRLRTILAHEVGVALEHGNLKTFPKSRRAALAESVDRMTLAARGQSEDVQEGIDSHEVLRAAGAPQILTSHSFAQSLEGYERPKKVRD
jgi:hypothetical protein